MKNKPALIVAVLAAIQIALLTGCVHAGNRSKTIHEIWHYQPTTNAPLLSHEIWSDENHGGGSALFADPKASELTTRHVNQTALGGGRNFSLGNIESTVSTNGLKAAGEAGGNVIGAAGRTAVGL